ncbi:hypothetical protein [Kibdelosporangium philippinense]|uniref:hypothetical protein n=1 Tax=Kibdelosporangium philippinense TaxID=211113 RepID=UPI00361E2690
MDVRLVDALAREIADLKANTPDQEATVAQWVAWFLRQANILDEIARIDPDQRDSARRQAQEARDNARAVASPERRGGVEGGAR